jgi:hypothetical protein
MEPRAVLMLDWHCTIKLHPKSFFFFFLRQDLSKAQADLELSIFLPQLPECWDYRCVLQLLAIAPLLLMPIYAGVLLREMKCTKDRVLGGYWKGWCITAIIGIGNLHDRFW